MDSALFYIITAVLAAGLFVLIARNLYVLDRQEEQRRRSSTPTAEQNDSTT